MSDFEFASQGASGGSLTSWFATLVQGLELGQPQVLVTVVRAQGSTPRDAGARMWVGPGGAVDTIGGGHLEWQAIAYAQAMLDEGKRGRQLRRFPLGPSLGQCCGGVMWLAFECLTQEDLPWCQAVSSALQQGLWLRRTLSLLDDHMPGIDTGPDLSANGMAGSSWDEANGQWVDIWAAPAMEVVVCGAGHVGQAIVRLLGDLPVRVTWLDPREDCWPQNIPNNVRVLQGDADEVVDLPDDAYWLVLTHSHALDLQIIEAILQHKPFLFLGLIGSKTKKARFESRLRQHFPIELVQRIQCPIGIIAMSSKLPAAIAVSAVAQLLSFLQNTPYNQGLLIN